MDFHKTEYNLVPFCKKIFKSRSKFCILSIIKEAEG